MTALDWIASGAAAGRSALVICSDIARYGIATAGEPTQGAGAVAMVISANPALVEIDHGVSGTASSHVHDFWRPLGQREAQVDGHYSVQCYLDAVAGAYRGWKARAIERGLVSSTPGELVSDQLVRVCYHVPFCKMARKAHLQVRRSELEDRGGIWDPAAEQAGIASFKTQVEPSLPLCARVGNIYTGSLYLGLTGLLHAQAQDLAGARIGLFSYGSGCTSEFFSGVVGKHAAARIAAAKLGELLDAREKISVVDYERIMALPPNAPMDGAATSAGFRFLGVTDHRRQYAGRP
jgi:hydroxymethylglutaryl-CoA synthase